MGTKWDVAVTVSAVCVFVGEEVRVLEISVFEGMKVGVMSA